MSDHPHKPVRRRLRIAIAVVIGLTVVWGNLTTPTLYGDVCVEFAWDRSGGFSYIRTVDGLGNLDPTYDHIFTNPVVVMQVAPRISSMLRNSGKQRYEGHIYYHVAFCYIVVTEVIE